jgi:murein DD-endopeptidase MepM/ murein hydrolase activator NlpD
MATIPAVAGLVQRMRRHWRTSPRLTAPVVLALAMAPVGACVPSGSDQRAGQSGPTASTSPREPGPASTPTPPPPAPAARPTPTKPAEPSPVDKRNRFFHPDKAPYASPWYEGKRRIMIGYGCTPAPYYRPHPRCRNQNGFHHGVDVALPCGARLFSPITGMVVAPGSGGRPGPAYGRLVLRIRAGGRDYLIGHAQKLYVRPGGRVRAGQLVAEVGDLGAPDGCHLHAEVRRAGRDLDGAVDPTPFLRFSR